MGVIFFFLKRFHVVKAFCFCSKRYDSHRFPIVMRFYVRVTEAHRSRGCMTSLPRRSRIITIIIVKKPRGKQNKQTPGGGDSSGRRLRAGVRTADKSNGLAHRADGVTEHGY